MLYKPKGKASEYSPLAVNYYKGCDHNCSYCYCKDFFHFETDLAKIRIKDDVLGKLETNLKTYTKKNEVRQQVLLCFLGDPYSKINEKYKMTKQVLELLLKYRMPVAILSKGGQRVLQDMDTFEKFGKYIKIGATLTKTSDFESMKVEPGAASTSERIKTLEILKENGIKTWVSLEPVLSVNESIELMRATVKFVDQYKIGCVSNYESKGSWDKLVKETLKIADKYDKQVYYKQELREKSDIVIPARYKDKEGMFLTWEDEKLL